MSVVALISKKALEHNLGQLSSLISPAQLMFIVKANGYGHGSEIVSKIAVESGIKLLGCLEIATALNLRKLPECNSVGLLAWQFDDQDPIDLVAVNNIQLGVGNFEQLDLLAKSHSITGKAVRVHLKIDTGLNRNGVASEDWKRFLMLAVSMEASGSIYVEAIWSHIAEKSDEDDDIARGIFLEALSQAEHLLGRKLTTHLSASSASFRRSEYRFDVVRNGGHAYGIPSFDGVSAETMGLIPVMTLTAPVVAIEKNSDGSNSVKIAAGYLHGIPGYAVNKVDLAIGGNRFRLVRIDSETLTAVGNSSVPLGEPAYLFGDGTHGEQTVREWGDAIGTLGDEICCRISPTVERKLI